MALAETNFTFEVIKNDLFSCSEDESLVHCVSQDLNMGKGIAVLFKQKFGGVNELKKQNCSVGEVAVLKRWNRYIYYLITKERYFHKPTYSQLKSSLLALKSHCLEHDVIKLSMPQIGCGLDKLDWNSVSEIIKETFNDTNIQITVCIKT